MHCLVFGVGLYFLPAIIAAVRHTHNVAAILILNLLVGWTGIGWLVVLVMALVSRPRWAYYYHPYWW
jgi:Superinfection immunity protein